MPWLGGFCTLGEPNPCKPKAGKSSCLALASLHWPQMATKPVHQASLLAEVFDRTRLALTGLT